MKRLGQIDLAIFVYLTCFLMPKDPSLQNLTIFIGVALITHITHERNMRKHNHIISNELIYTVLIQS